MISIKSIYKIDSDYQKLKNEKSFFFKNSLLLYVIFQIFAVFFTSQRIFRHLDYSQILICNENNG